jgi:hypothetical protein
MSLKTEKGENNKESPTKEKKRQIMEQKPRQ